VYLNLPRDLCGFFFFILFLKMGFYFRVFILNVLLPVMGLLKLKNPLAKKMYVSQEPDIGSLHSSIRWLKRLL